MYLSRKQLVSSATDARGYIARRHVVTLEREGAGGEQTRPKLHDSGRDALPSELADAMRADGTLDGALPRPEPPDPGAPENVQEESERVQVLMERWLDGVPDDPAERSDAQQARWILAHLLSWHRREQKSTWCEYYRMMELAEDELLLDAKALAAQPSETSLDAARRIAPALDRTVLPIQGPPGSGKTYIGARMVVELVRPGRRGGVTANSHKVIVNLLDKICEAADEAVLSVGGDGGSEG